MRLTTWLAQNLWAIMSAVIIGLVSYATGTERTSVKMADLEARVEKLEGRADGRDRYDACSTRYFDRIVSGGKGPPPCDLGGM